MADNTGPSDLVPFVYAQPVDDEKPLTTSTSAPSYGSLLVTPMAAPANHDEPAVAVLVVDERGDNPVIVMAEDDPDDQELPYLRHETYQCSRLPVTVGLLCLVFFLLPLAIVSVTLPFAKSSDPDNNQATSTPSPQIPTAETLPPAVIAPPTNVTVQHPT